ncbi:aspartate dehydrogenase domain-containing protein [Acuticoccus kandeliae]|uniref:aspartate dehydrogenase domain-containing protein n=1 Tax=Acuticoccus kandeliae TaxID=2073160 RepID=UPI000D3E3BFB|nr:aspartate dehydrogenase domain-containing protein [Acuticoccus kandeliae]
MSREPRRILLMGTGRIGAPVVAHVDANPSWTIAAILTRRDHADPRATTDPDRFFATPADLVIDTAGPVALRTYGARALEVAETWTISASALVDTALYASLAAAAEAHGHRLRLMSGAIGGLDAVAAAAADPDARLLVEAARPGIPGMEAPFEGTLAEAVAAYPNEINIAATSALAGPGPAATRVRLSDPGPGGAHTLSLTVSGRAGHFTSRLTVEPDPARRIQPVSASIIAALRQELQPIRVG